MSGALAVLALVATSSAASGPAPMRLLEGSAVTFTAHQTFSSTDGRFSKFSGDFLIDLDAPERSRISVSIDAASIDTDDDSRDEHLRNPDFFDVARYPKIAFESTKITSKPSGWVAVQGKLRIKDRAVPVAFDMQLERQEGGKVRARGRLTVSRARLGLDYEAPIYLPSIKDNVNIALDVRLGPQ